MSSLTTMSSSMDEEPEELVDTRLSLVIGAGSQPPPPSPPVQALLAQAQDQSAGRKRKRENGGRPHSKIRTRTTKHGGSNADADHDEGRDGGGGASKKLRLTGEQAALLEHSFRSHSIISHDEKHDLARRVGLRPRQVEVWFQNRRARTKLKQTELDRELLWRWHEQLTDENARLRRQVAEARASAASRLATTAACPSCSTLPSAGGRLSPADRDVVIAAVPSKVRRPVRSSRGLQFRRRATVS